MAICNGLTFYMSKSGIRQRDLPHAVLGSATCSTAAVEEK